MAKRFLGAQLYTVRDLISQDFAGTVKQVAKLVLTELKRGS